jgi:hypothetical protein
MKLKKFKQICFKSLLYFTQCFYNENLVALTRRQKGIFDLILFCFDGILFYYNDPLPFSGTVKTRGFYYKWSITTQQDVTRHLPTVLCNRVLPDVSAVTV